MLEKEYKFYKENLSGLLLQYKAKYIVIRDLKVVGAYDTEKTAYEEAVKKWDLGTFLIKHCIPEQDEVVQTFHSRVIFA